MDDDRQVLSVCFHPVHSTEYSAEAIQRNAQMLLFGMGDWTASSSDSDHEKENVEPAEKKHKSLNRKELDRWYFIGEERENDLSRK